MNLENISAAVIMRAARVTLTLFLFFSATSQGATITYRFEGTLDDSVGSLPAGTAFIGLFTYDSTNPERSGIGDPEVGVYELDFFELDIGGDLIRLNGFGGTTQIDNRPTFDQLSTQHNSAVTQVVGSVEGGVFGGVDFSQNGIFDFLLVDFSATALSSDSLPEPGLMLSDFPDFARLTLRDNDGNIFLGSITDFRAVSNQLVRVSFSGVIDEDPSGVLGGDLSYSGTIVYDLATAPTSITTSDGCCPDPSRPTTTKTFNIASFEMTIGGAQISGESPQASITDSTSPTSDGVSFTSSVPILTLGGVTFTGLTPRLGSFGLNTAFSDIGLDGVADVYLTTLFNQDFELFGTGLRDADEAGINGTTVVFGEVAPDDQPPSWSIPGDISVIATSLSGAVVSYIAIASDNVGVISASCFPASGTTFPVGSTLVTCTATDAAGNIAEASFNVSVSVDAGSTDTLIDGIESLGLTPGAEASLRSTLGQIDRLINDSNPNNDSAVCDKLVEFLLKVDKRLGDGSLTAEQASDLRLFAQALQTEFGCVP